MATTSVTNQVASQALRGQDVIVTLNSSDSANLTNFQVGYQCCISGSSIYGVVSRIDSYGHTFHVTPVQPNLTFSSSSTPGYLNASETVIVSTIPYLP